MPRLVTRWCKCGAIFRSAKFARMVKASARANLRRLIKRVLRRYGYPPDMQEKSTQAVHVLVELMAGE